MTDEDVDEQPERPEQGQARIPLLPIELSNCQVGIAPHPEDPDGCQLIVGPILVSFLLPFSGEGARELARQLNGGIVVAPAAALNGAKMAPSLKRQH